MQINWGLLSKYKLEIYGLSILLIMLFHGIVTQIKGGLNSFLQPYMVIIKHGNCGVEIFLFLAGIFCFFSMTKKLSISAFYVRKLLRIVIPFFCITGSYWSMTEATLENFFFRITQLSFWFGNDHFAWFINIILICYFLYPFIYKNILLSYSMEKSLLIISFYVIFIYIGCFLLNHSSAHIWFKNVEIVLTRLPSFFIGCWVGQLVYKNVLIKEWIKCLSFLILLFGICILSSKYSIVLNYRWIYLPISLSLSIWAAIILEVLNCRIFNKILLLFGKLSLELYLIHVVLLHITFQFHLYSNNSIIRYYQYIIYCIVGALIISYILHPFFVKIQNYIYHRLYRE